MKIETIKFNEDHTSVNNLVVVMFKDYERAPMYGFFVKMHDHEELTEKKMVRFVPRSMDQMFISKPITAYTRIFSVLSFKNLTQ